VTGKSRVFGRVVNLPIDSWTECWVPSAKCVLPLFVKHTCSEPKQKMCSALARPHLLELCHPSVKLLYT
jgi:hypothetical protein